MRRIVTLLLSVAFLNGCCSQNTSSDAERRTASYFDSVRQQPVQLQAFLREMPKGGDLHNHLSGAIYAESLLAFAAGSGLCVERATSTLQRGSCDTKREGKQVLACAPQLKKPAVSCAYQDASLYNQIIDAWSMRNWKPGTESGHDHFFATFGKFSEAMNNHVGDALAEAASRAGADRLDYLELMYTADGDRARALVKNVHWNDNLATLQSELIQGIKDIVAPTLEQLNQDEGKMKSLLKCDSPEAAAGCNVTVRYLYQVGRGNSTQQVFAQMLLGFELAQADQRFVGLNLVMPEDWPVPMRDFDLHVKMLDYLHGLYPKIHISLHAGELAMGLVPPEGLRFHIRDSVKWGHAERIGHGVDITYEDERDKLLKKMADDKILVEICLTSNDGILGVRGAQHPLKLYLDNNVPVALATDDEGCRART
jgi:adenosine deaminase